MAQNLVKLREKGSKKGEPYQRPALVEADIDVAIGLDDDKIFARLSIGDPKADGYLRSECLVHLIRCALKGENAERYNRLLPVLLKRCERNLISKISARIVPYAEGLRDVILQDFATLFVEDLGDPDEGILDMFECKFNLAFSSLRIDRFRQEMNHFGRYQEPSNSRSASRGDDEADKLARFTDEDWLILPQEAGVLKHELHDAILGLPPDVRKALILVKFYHLKEESSDPDETTAAKLCGCTGRTIRNRLKEARKQLAPFKEYLKK